MTEENNTQISRDDVRKGASMAPIEDGEAELPESEPTIDDRGTDQSEALEVLTSIRDDAFDSSNEKLAVALGRPIEEIEQWIDGTATIDADVLQKARALAIERGLQIE